MVLCASCVKYLYEYKSLDIKLSSVFAETETSMRLLKEVRPARTRMMIVDDDGDLRMALADYFETRGFEVVSMRSGTIAVDRLSTNPEPFDNRSHRPGDARRGWTRRS